jgi:hypothetical protein
MRVKFTFKRSKYFIFRITIAIFTLVITAQGVKFHSLQTSYKPTAADELSVVPVACNILI